MGDLGNEFLNSYLFAITVKWVNRTYNSCIAREVIFGLVKPTQVVALCCGILHFFLAWWLNFGWVLKSFHKTICCFGDDNHRIFPEYSPNNNTGWYDACFYVSIYLCVCRLSHYYLSWSPIPTSLWSSSYQFDWMMCNMSPLIWFDATTGVSGFSQL